MVPIARTATIRQKGEFCIWTPFKSFLPSVLDRKFTPVGRGLSRASVCIKRDTHLVPALKANNHRPSHATWEGHLLDCSKATRKPTLSSLASGSCHPRSADPQPTDRPPEVRQLPPRFT